MKVPLSLNRKLVLEAPAQTADGAGGFSTDWTALGTMWGNVTARSGRTVNGEGAVHSQVRYRIIVRSAPVGSSMRPKPEQRFKEGTRLYRIDAVSESDLAGLYLECWAHEEVVQ